ncbi:MAG TPA: hypothetical protein DCX80_06590 [Chloroflexi bacterium]|nr:hypothetical protein [Chloroflexota bacterium]
MMADWGTHIVMDGVWGIVPDLPLAVAATRERRIHPRRQRWHRLLHHPVAGLLAGLVWALTGQQRYLALARHVALDHMTHRRGWRG